jgi:hypothetical protein
MSASRNYPLVWQEVPGVPGGPVARQNGLLNNSIQDSFDLRQMSMKGNNWLGDPTALGELYIPSAHSPHQSHPSCAR